MNEKKTCELCGLEFEPGAHRGKERLCEKCRDRIIDEYAKWIENGKHLKKRQCIVCGADISEMSKKAVVCSRYCHKILEGSTRQWRKSRQKEYSTAYKRRGGTDLKGSKARAWDEGATKRMSQLDRDILDARKAGLSYGEYMGTKRKREERL